jgi:asparagine synthetase B (glutamine-hydrolysing)
MSDLSELPNKLRVTLIDEIKSYQDTDVAVLLSSGVDSHTILFAALAAGKNVHCYSFVMENIESRDCRIAKNTADLYKLPFTKITLPTSLDILVSDLNFIINEIGCSKKTDIECFWPMMYSMNQIKEHTILTGHGADHYYGIGRKANQHYHGRLDEYRELSFNNDGWSQKKFIHKYGKLCNKWFAYPYHTKKIFDLFKGTTYNDLNKPFQKNISREAFKSELSICKIFNNSPLQLGDSGIALHFEKLLTTNENKNASKSVVGIYNNIKREYNKVKLNEFFN